jgi:hypothetical protein
VRKAINENPVVQAALLGVLAIVVAFLMLTRVMGGQETTTPTTTTDATGTVTTPAATSGVAPAGDATAPAPAEAATPAPAGDFTAGPGLPKAVVASYERGDTVALLVTRPSGVDDRDVDPLVKRIGAVEGVAFFETTPRHVFVYSRIAAGVNLDRTPALVVLSPRRASKGETPTASVSYGYRGLESFMQAVRDARYKGPELPYYPK